MKLKQSAKASKLPALPKMPVLPKIDFRAAANQFQGLELNAIGDWPILPKLSALLGILLVMCGLSFMLLWQEKFDSLSVAVDQENTLKTEYQAKFAKALNVATLLKQKELATNYVIQLEKRLPGKAEMEELLSDINQAGVGHGLEFELFKPGTPQIMPHYAELPIQIRVVGRYHSVGQFVSDVANLPRIVTLKDLRISQSKDGQMIAMDATAKTYRYLQPNEFVAPAAPAAGDKKGGHGV